MNNRKGFSLTEILATIVILAVLAGIAIPGFSKSKDKAEAAQAVAYLRTIRLAEKMYFAKNATYINCTDKTALLNTLGVEVTTEHHTFAVTAADATTFTATATRSTGAAGTITLYANGTWDATGRDSKYEPGS